MTVDPKSCCPGAMQNQTNHAKLTRWRLNTKNERTKTSVLHTVEVLLATIQDYAKKAIFSKQHAYYR